MPPAPLGTLLPWGAGEPSCFPPGGSDVRHAACLLRVALEGSLPCDWQPLARLK